MTITMPDGTQAEVHDLSSRQLLVPAGTALIVPAGHEWTIMSLTAPPVRGWIPPIGTATRNAEEWGDIQIRLGARPLARISTLTLMDRYWGRCNLAPELPDVVAKLAHAQHAVATAPTIHELRMTLERAGVALDEYMRVAAPPLIPLQMSSQCCFVVEHIDCENASQPHVVRPIDVELYVIIKRPVS